MKIAFREPTFQICSHLACAMKPYEKKNIIHSLLVRARVQAKVLWRETALLA